MPPSLPRVVAQAEFRGAESGRALRGVARDQGGALPYCACCDACALGIAVSAVARGGERIRRRKPAERPRREEDLELPEEGSARQSDGPAAATAPRLAKAAAYGKQHPRSGGDGGKAVQRNKRPRCERVGRAHPLSGLLGRGRARALKRTTHLKQRQDHEKHRARNVGCYIARGRWRGRLDSAERCGLSAEHCLDRLRVVERGRHDGWLHRHAKGLGDEPSRRRGLRVVEWHVEALEGLHRCVRVESHAATTGGGS